MAEPPLLVVLGSVNLDYTVRVESHPVPGETVTASGLFTGAGGKGANQAVAAAHAGVRPVLVGAVGADAAGTDLRIRLGDAGVDVANLVEDATQPTGIALITVDASGENSIVVVAGANGSLQPSATSTLVGGLLRPGAVLLVQLEIPLDVVAACAAEAERRKARLVLNLSPSAAAPPALLALADPLIVNQRELAVSSGMPTATVAEAELAAESLLTRCRSVVTTLGAGGALLTTKERTLHFPAPKVPVVDTTGAGDAFAGTLAASLAQGDAIEASVERAIAAGSAAVQHVGAQLSGGAFYP